jgi:hypothetical protein
MAKTVQAAAVAEFGREVFEAFGEAARIWTDGAKAMAERSLASAQAAMSDANGTVTALAGARSVHQATEIQVAALRRASERAMADASATAEELTRLAQAASAPLAAKATEAASRVGLSKVA